MSGADENTCDVCGAPAPVDYASHEACNEAGCGVVLCRHCEQAIPLWLTGEELRALANVAHRAADIAAKREHLRWAMLGDGAVVPRAERSALLAAMTEESVRHTRKILELLGGAS